MIKKIAVICLLVCFVFLNVSQVSSSVTFFSKLAQEALKLVATEGLKIAVDYFKDRFNKDKAIAKRYGKPELKGGEIKENVRTWEILPVGKLSKNDIKDIAQTLKSLDENRDQIIHATIKNVNQIFKTTQSGVVTQSGNFIESSDNTMIATGVDYVAGNKIQGDYVAGNKIVAPSEPPKIQDIECTSKSLKENCPLEIHAYGYELPHPEGSNVDGIIWNADRYSDVRVWLKNSGRTRLHNISFMLHPETHVGEAVQATKNPGVTIVPDFMGIREIAVDIVDEKGVHHMIPTSPAQGYIAPRIKLQASELLGGGEMKIVMACVATNPVNSKKLYAPRRSPKWIRISGYYDTMEAGSEKRFHFNEEFQLGGKLAR